MCSIYQLVKRYLKYIAFRILIRGDGTWYLLKEKKSVKYTGHFVDNGNALEKG